MANHKITYESKNGFRGELDGIEMIIRDKDNLLRFHTYSSGYKTQKELKQFVDEFPEFLELMKGVIDDGV